MPSSKRKTPTEHHVVRIKRILQFAVDAAVHCERARDGWSSHVLSVQKSTRDARSSTT